MSVNTFRARVAQIEPLSADTRSYRFEALQGAPFAGATPGSHLDIAIPAGAARGEYRQYSLWDWDADGRWASVAAKREAEGRGGSRWLHDALREGDRVELAGPRNAFELLPAGEYLLIAGGIGVTPIFAMASALKAEGKRFRCCYLTRDRSLAAFAGKFAAAGIDDELIQHFDQEQGFCDFDALLAPLGDDARVFVCGPEGMLKAVLAAGEKAGISDRVHFERFAAVDAAAGSEDAAFTIELARSGQSFEIPPGQTILSVLQDADVDVDYACSSGVCGACIVDVIEGDIEHRDSVLSDDEHAGGELMCLCVSRARGDKLVVDL